MMKLFLFSLSSILLMIMFVPMMNDVYAHPMTGYVFNDYDGNGLMIDPGDIGENNITVHMNGTSYLASTLTSTYYQFMSSPGASGYYSLNHGPNNMPHMLGIEVPVGKIFTNIPQFSFIPTINHPTAYNFGIRDIQPLQSDMAISSSSTLYDIGNGIEIPSQHPSQDVIITKDPTTILS